LNQFKSTKANDSNNDQKMTDTAWARLQESLSQESEQPQWKLWMQEAQVKENLAAETLQGTQMELAAQMVDFDLQAAVVGQAAAVPVKVPLAAAAKPIIDEADAAKHTGMLGSWVRRNNKRICMATAACLLIAVIATPIGNQALAAILNKFRMQQVTVVDQNELQQLFYSASIGETRESFNKFGAFTQTSGKISGEHTADEASKLLGRNIVVPQSPNGKDQKLYISSSNAITLNLHVDEVNKTMQRLGAKKLLPQSIDGKPITLEIGETVHLQTSVKERPGYSFSQQPVPVVTVDPSISVAEALDAVLQFPLLPEGLKQSLQQANVLNGGSIPLPVITNGQSEKIKLGNLDVIVTTENPGKHVYYNAIWVKNGQLFTLSGGPEVFTSRQAMLDQLAELIKL
jgi:hypothetical protein